MAYGTPQSAGMSVSAEVPLTQVTQLPGGADSPNAQHQRASTTAVWVFLVFGLVYVAYAFVAKHQKVRAAVEPHNIAANLHNLIVIFLGAVFSIGLFKIAAVKMQAAKLPGGKTLAKLAGLI